MSWLRVRGRDSVRIRIGVGVRVRVKVMIRVSQEVFMIDSCDFKISLTTA